MTGLKPAVIDANVLFSATVRDLLIRCHIAGVIRIHWTARILDETFIAIERERPGLDVARLHRTRVLMNAGARGADITKLVDDDIEFDEADVPDANDLHVVRAAVAIGGDIVTWNLSDFPPRLVEPLGVVAMSPDDYFAACASASRDAIHRVIARQAADLTSPPTTATQLLERLRHLGLGKFTEILRAEPKHEQR